MNKKPTSSHPPKRVFNRRNFLATTFMGAAGSLAYARYIEPRQLTVTRKEIHLARLPDALDGLIISQLTDFHYRPGFDDELIANAVASSNAAKPDIVALTGDFVTDSHGVFEPLMSQLNKLKARHGIYSILGNHDGWHADLGAVQQGFRKAGFEFLRNQGSRISIAGENMHIVGTDSVWSGSIDARACFKGCKNHPAEPVLALVHEPDVFDALCEHHPFTLQLSGHTHGGQCRVPWIGYAPVKVRYGKKYIYGEYGDENSKLFVSRGLGTVDIPVRFACAPELAILTLRRARD